MSNLHERRARSVIGGDFKMSEAAPAQGRNLFYAAFFLSLALCLLSAHSAIGEIWQQWKRDEYSHGPIVPLIAILLAWHRLVALRPVPRTDRGGLWVLLGGVFLLLVGELSTFYQIALWGLLLSLVGLWYSFFGRDALKAVLPSFGYAFLAIPIPQLLFATLSSQLQLLSSTIGVGMLDAMGFAVFQEGNVIDLGGYKLQVVEACSGLRYLFPLLSFSYLAAYLLDGPMWKRIIIFLSAVPITIGMNCARIALIGVTVNYWGIGMAGGLLHDFEGWSIFLVCVVLLMLEISALNLVGGRSTLRLNYLGLAKGPLFGAQPDLGRSGLAALGVVGLLGLSATIGLFTNSKSILPDHRDFAEFPMAFDRWHGRRGDIDANVLGELKLTDYVIADYSESFDKLPINLYVAFYASQTIGSSIHSPSTCIPGGGWRIVDNQVVTVPLPGLAAPVSLSRLVIQRGEAREMVYYWFDERGRDVTDQFAAKWHLMQDSYHHHRTDGALIRYVTALAPGEDLAHAEERLRGFLALTVPTVEQFLPEPLADL